MCKKGSTDQKSVHEPETCELHPAPQQQQPTADEKVDDNGSAEPNMVDNSTNTPPAAAAAAAASDSDTDEEGVTVAPAPPPSARRRPTSIKMTSTFNEKAAAAPMIRTHSVQGISKAKIKTVKLTVVVILGYIFCSAPFICIQLWATFGRSSLPEYVGEFFVQ